jgi:hypothetical protein
LRKVELLGNLSLTHAFFVVENGDFGDQAELFRAPSGDGIALIFNAHGPIMAVNEYKFNSEFSLD